MGLPGEHPDGHPRWMLISWRDVPGHIHGLCECDSAQDLFRQSHVAEAVHFFSSLFNSTTYFSLVFCSVLPFLFVLLSSARASAFFCLEYLYEVTPGGSLFP